MSVVKVKCPKCGTQVAPGYDFCLSCGTKFSEVSPTKKTRSNMTIKAKIGASIVVIAIIFITFAIIWITINPQVPITNTFGWIIGIPIFFVIGGISLINKNRAETRLPKNAPNALYTEDKNQKKKKSSGLKQFICECIFVIIVLIGILLFGVLPNV